MFLTKISFIFKSIKIANNSISNLKSHLGRVHKLEKFLTNGQKLQIGCMNALTSKLKISKNEKNKIDDIALQAVVQDSCAFNVFSKPGMRAFIQYLKPGYQPPNRKTIARRLKKK